MSSGEGRRAEGGARATRPRNRRALITAAASELFYRRGYTQVGVSDIAAVVGISPSALYRHFAGKQQLLTRVVLDQLEPLEHALAEVGVEDAELTVRKLASAALHSRELGVLWQRESRHLPENDRSRLKKQLRSVATRLSSLATAYQPGLADTEARFRAWCFFSAVTSPAYHQMQLPREQFETLLADMVKAIADHPPLAFSRRKGQLSRAEGGSMTGRRASRRRLLMSAGTRLFAEYGYGAVTTEDIGAAVGIAGPSVYNHFASKQDLLNAIISRGMSWLELELEHVLAVSAEPREMLRGLLSSYIAFALEHRGFIDLLVGEVGHLSEVDRHRARQIQHEYVSEWVGLLREARPELELPVARILVQAALTVANDMVRTGGPRDRDAVASVGAALMFTTGHRSA